MNGVVQFSSKSSVPHKTLVTSLQYEPRGLKIKFLKQQYLTNNTYVLGTIHFSVTSHATFPYISII